MGQVGNGANCLIGGATVFWRRQLGGGAVAALMRAWKRPGQDADPLSLVVDVTSWYDEEQLRLVKGTI
jgi:hypothetical protein